MRINYNVSAMLANNTLTGTDSMLSKSIERLSSGLKINHGKDNPAGLAMAKRMNGQIVGTGVAKQNSSDGVSVLETADGALQEVHSMLHRMSELATKAANGTNTDEDREIIQKEIDQLKDEISRVSSSTQFNSQNLLDGSFGLKGYADVNEVKLSNLSAEVNPGDYTLSNISWIADAKTGELTVDTSSIVFGAGFPSTNVADYNISMNDNFITIKGDGNFQMTLEIEKSQVFDSNGDPKSGTFEGTDSTGAKTNSFTFNATGVGAMRLQIGSNEGQVIEVEIPEISLGNMGIQELDVSTEDKAKYAIDRLSTATDFLNSVRGSIGAYQNRLESTEESLGVVDENLTSAYSRIMDVDMAEEMTQYSTYNIMVQAGTSVLAQANERPSMALQLLQ